MSEQSSHEFIGQRIRLKNCLPVKIGFRTIKPGPTCEIDGRLVKVSELEDKRAWLVVMPDAWAKEIEQGYMNQPALLVIRGEQWGYACEAAMILKVKGEPASRVIMRHVKAFEAFFNGKAR